MTDGVERIPIIAFDGNHRAGKGTQIRLLEAFLVRGGLHPYRLRGDGSRTGAGMDCSDPYSEWWQEFKANLKSFENEYDAWRIGARRLLAEAAVKFTCISSDSNAVLLFDRSYLSRAQMTLKEGLDLSHANMYFGQGENVVDDGIIDATKPDLVVYLDAPSHVLTGRLTQTDPKFDFRNHNIINSEDYFEEAFASLIGFGENIVKLDGDQPPEQVFECVRDVIITQNILNRTDIQ